MRRVVILCVLLLAFAGFTHTVLGQLRLDLIRLEGPRDVVMGQTFSVTLTVGHSLPANTHIWFDLYEHGGPMIGHADDHVSGQGQRTYSFVVVAPSRVTEWRLNAHGLYIDNSGVQRESDLRLTSVFVKQEQLSLKPASTFPASGD